MQVERRQRLTARDDRRHPLDCAEQRRKTRRTEQDDPPAAGCDQRRVPDDLDVGAQALFGVEQDRSPLKVAAVPRRAAEIDPAGLEFRQAPPPLIFCKPRLVMPGFE